MIIYIVKLVSFFFSRFLSITYDYMKQNIIDEIKKIKKY